MPPAGNSLLQGRLFYADALRVVAALLVVTAHIALGLLYFSPPERPLSWFDWHFAAAINSSARWIVAGFVMVSGAFLLNPARDEPPALFYRKSLSRIGIPLLFWSAFYTTIRILHRLLQPFHHRHNLLHLPHLPLHVPQPNPPAPIARLITRALAPAALGVYLVHPLFLDLLSPLTLGGGGNHWPPAVKIATGAVVVFTLSYVLTAILMKIPFLRRTVGYG